MAKAKKEKVEVLKKISLKDLAEKYKKRIHIVYEGDTLFTMEELANKDFDEFIRNIMQAKRDDLEVDENTNTAMLGFDEDNIAWLIKHMIKSDVVDINALDSKETLEAINSFGVDIMSQITDAIKELALKPMNTYFEKLNQHFEELMAKAKEEQERTEVDEETES